MGSMSMLSDITCEICGVEMPPTYPYLDECPRCTYQQKLVEVLLAWPPELRCVLHKVVGYITFDHRKAHRLYFLRCVLLARGSVFCKFTYYSNNMLGNIDETTDVIDHIMHFVANPA